MSAGLAAAQADVVAVIDADLQDPPELIFEMLERWRAGDDVVYARRRRRQEALVSLREGECFGEMTLVDRQPRSATVRALYSGLTGGYSVRAIQQAPVQATLQSVTVAPGSVSLRSGQQQAFSATAHYSDGSTKDVTGQATWSHSNPAAGTLTGNVFQVSYQYQTQSTVVTAGYTEGTTVSGTASVSVGP